MQPAPQTAMPAARAVAASRARRVSGGPVAGRVPCPGAGRAGRPVLAGPRAQWLAGQLVRAAEQHRGAVAPARRQGQLLLHGRVGHGQQDQVHRLGQVGQGRVAGPPGDPLVPRVDQVHLGPRRALGDLADHPLAQAARPGAGPDQGHAAGLQHRGQGGPDGAQAPPRFPEDREPGRRHRRRSWCSLRAVRAGHARRVSRRTCPARLALFWSAIAARAACQPGIPHTPPPACVAELP